MHSTPLKPMSWALLGLVAVSPASAGEWVSTMDDIIVTATRTPRPRVDAPGSVTVIGRDELERHQAGSLFEVLRTVPGLDVTRNGGLGKTTTVLMRGTNAGHVLVLVDGVRAGSATLGIFSWENLPPEQIERIEIVRGPRAALYGSDAIGGVIQIFTRRAQRAFVQAGLGAHGTRSVDAGFGGGDGWRYSLSVGDVRSDGIPSTAAVTEDHGHSNTHVAGGLAGELLPGLKLKLDVSHVQGRNELDAITGNEAFRQQVASVRLDHEVSETWVQRLTLGTALDDYTTQSAFAPANITTRRTSLAWQHDLRLSGAALTTVGLDFWRDSVDKDRSGEIHQDLDTTALYAQHQWRAAGSDWVANLRRDHHDRYGGETTGSLAWGFDLSPTTRLSASYGTAFKAPTVNDLYWPLSRETYFGTTYVTGGNPDLSPETSRAAELGWRYRPTSTVGMEANLFRTRIKDLIEWRASQTGPDEYTYLPENVGRATIDGLEVNADARLDRWYAEAGLTLLSAEDAATGRRLDRRPARRFTLRLGHQLGGGDLQGEWILASARNDLGGSVRLAGYGLVNLAYRRPLSDAVELLVRLENLFDKDYVLASSFSGDYNTLGRSLFLTLRYAP